MDGGKLDTTTWEYIGHATQIFRVTGKERGPLRGLGNSSRLGKYEKGEQEGMFLSCGGGKPRHLQKVLKTERRRESIAD